MLMLTIISIVIIIYTIKAFKKSKVDNIKEMYHCNEGSFIATGKRDKFIIKKGKYFSFLVVDGTIVACKDSRESKNFVFYGGGDNELA